jgi:Fur family transcriptional regulator, ferric uptake regulator
MPASPTDPSTPDDLRAQLEIRLNEFWQRKGIKKTRPRLALIDFIFSTDDHFTAEELLQRVQNLKPKISRATVYRTLSLLEESKLLQVIDLGIDQKVYDPNFIDKPHHNHLVCLDCHKVLEFEDKHISVLEDCITRRLGFRIAHKAIRIEGHCEELIKTGKCKQARHAT